ncbi:MAG TPA: ABC transporter permease [Gaiellaceae bacterium]|nr:ABC transporter permease [Gaiellaceae bacterium]
MAPAVTTTARARRQRPPRGSAGYLRTHRRLLWRSTRNQIRVRYAGSILGVSWVVLAPALLLTVYGVVYLEVYKVRAPGLGATAFVLYIFAGLVPFLMTAQALTEGAGSLVDDPSLLTNTVFPIDLAPVRAVLSTLPVLLIGTSAVVIGSAASGRADWPLVLLPAVILLQVMALVGVAWFLSLATVVARDIQYVITIVILVLLVASPIAYTTRALHGPVRALIFVNPLAWFVIAYQKILVLGESPSPGHWAALVVAGCGLFLGGSRFFVWAKGVAMDYV